MSLNHTVATKDTKAEAPLAIHGLSVAYQKKPVLRNISFEVNEGELIGVIGPNGAGKSTLMKAALGLIPSIAGEVLVYGKPYKQQRKLIGYVPQRESVDWDFPTNALDVVLMGRYGHLGWFRRPGAKEKAIAMEALSKVGMSDYADRQISQLSGGQQQRVFLARALAQDAKLYFMDEPFAGVDAATEKAIITLLQELKLQGKTVIVVHHDLATVQDYFDSVLLLNVELQAYGPTAQTFTQEQLQRTYGGRLAFLDRSLQSPSIPDGKGE
ncbi:metal ABC transporter ATP-binding protein [Paenibacillus alkaliterrae]|uniref:metal ABC transporter ATP-binding protein n=1 Tax=Paenibacillus alkaliterrae TaxID=320909 RepID=UPI001F361913|nr:metal ABC transporter ATP-binding protein [Paenibacillus alkaliterrae]MCF2937870.1 metal ABC transporter ATP-binding protein [Paenibacillus alkaliterrae]